MHRVSLSSIPNIDMDVKVPHVSLVAHAHASLTSYRIGQWIITIMCKRDCRDGCRPERTNILIAQMRLLYFAVLLAILGTSIPSPGPHEKQ